MTQRIMMLASLLVINACADDVDPLEGSSATKTTGEPTTGTTDKPPTTGGEPTTGTTGTTTDQPTTGETTGEPPPPTCGDGILDEGEECDDGKRNDDAAACTPNCKDAVCGDGKVWADVEECDDGNDVDGDGCSATCVSEKPPVCGDGILNEGEKCDLGEEDNGDEALCLGDCTLAACGDGLIGPGEGCDDGNVDNGDGCNSGCVPEGCGNKMVEPGELCDDGQDGDPDDGCTDKCSLPACGDGFVQPSKGEECDDGNVDNTDACTHTCKNAACGDGFVGPSEECDDGNDEDNDGCTNACEVPHACGHACDKLSECGFVPYEVCIGQCLEGSSSDDVECQTALNAYNACVGEAQCTDLGNDEACLDELGVVNEACGGLLTEQWPISFGPEPEENWLTKAFDGLVSMVGG